MRISDWSSDVCSSDLDANGLINIAAFEALLGRDVAVVSVMAVNNEIGTIQPLETIRDRAFRIGAFFHTDATQAPAAMPIVVAEWGVDAASFSGHKIYGPKGIGRSEEHTSELQSLMRISYAVFCLKKKITKKHNH